MAGIIYANYYVPEDKVPTSEFVEEKIASVFIKQYKLEYVYIEKKRDPVEIARTLVKKFFDTGGCKPGEISHIIYTASPNLKKDKVCIPYFLQSCFQMNSAAILLMKQECNSVLQAIQLASALVDSGKADKVMILGMSYGTDKKERFIRTTVIGDGAGLMVIGKEGYQARVKDFISVSDGRFSQDQYENREHKRDSLDIVRSGADLILGLLKRSNLEIKDIDIIVPQNINFLGFFAYARILGINPDRVFSKNISGGGHMVDIDTIRNYSDYAAGIGPGSQHGNAPFILYGTSTIDAFNITYDVILMDQAT